MGLEAFSLKGKVALVTGAKRGIGAGIAVALAEAGAEVIGVSASLETEGSEIARRVAGVGGRFSAYACDFADRAAVYAFLEKVQAEHPVIDILFNNAGTILRKPAAEHPDEFWDKVIDVNLNAPFVVTRELGKRMLERGWGKVVFTASLLTF